MYMYIYTHIHKFIQAIYDKIRDCQEWPIIGTRFDLSVGVVGSAPCRHTANPTPRAKSTLA